MTGFLIHSPLEHYALHTPDNPALSLKQSTMSYAELNDASNRFAHALLENGANVQDRIGIFLHKSFELAIAMYGILKAGCVFVPLDPFMPADRLEFIIKDCNIRQLASSDLLAPTIQKLDPSLNLTVLGANSLKHFSVINWESINQQPSQLPELIFIDQLLGYIMYTSGSTGEPKGMMHTHSGSICYAKWGANHVKLSSKDRVASHAPLHFDLSIFDFFSTLQSGATVVLVPEAITKFPASWTKLIEDEQISVFFTVPYTLITMVEQGAMEQRDLNSLRWIMFGGEPYPPRQLRMLMNKLPQVQLTNVYGPAEAPSCTCYDIPRPLPDGDEPLPIGHVSINSEDLIIDENEQECLTGEAGELCIRSSTLTRGYWNRPDLNKKAFLIREGYGPFPTVYYRTGDRVVRHEDGLLRFLGRVDRMIKTRGHRVELDEVEAAMASLEGVLEVAAFTVPDEHASHIILARATVDDQSALTNDDILAFVKTKLPPYAVPREITLTDALPHTSSGKVDRKTLSEQWIQSNR